MSQRTPYHSHPPPQMVQLRYLETFVLLNKWSHDDSPKAHKFRTIENALVNRGYVFS